MSTVLLLECDRCRFREDSVQSTREHGGSMVELRKAAARQGWTRINGKDNCKECAEWKRNGHP